MNDPLAAVAYIAISAVIAILLLVFAPVVLLDYGLAIAWGWISILLSWIAVEMLHADFEDNEFNDPADREIVHALRQARAQHDDFGVGTHGRDDKLYLKLERLTERGYLEVERYEDGDCWWRASI